MSSISSIRNISKRNLCSNFFIGTSLPSLQWRFYSRARSPQQFTRTINLKVSPFLYTPFPSHPFSTLNSKSKVGFIGWYLGKLDSRPILTKTITTSLIFAAADLTAQMLSPSSGSGSFDLIRTLRMAAYGLLILGPSQHLWFNLMSKTLPKRDVLTTLKKTFMGQAIYGPANAIVFFSYNAALQAIGEQCVCISMDNLFNIHGKLTKSDHQLIFRILLQIIHSLYAL
ncbi:uncharacterized protein LOC110639996 isoform X2 [Hevea brasiliensis]|uniref:uncharacterized protein LOC110639996 isoform X2 n=1 Tax=Hevea brasiliensis TaxID=3981 RepID=UPI0025FC1259|nr:uncharacterized protein LOC110639996 isoform X2 [Hevea brasiliensis]